MALVKYDEDGTVTVTLLPSENFIVRKALRKFAKSPTPTALQVSIAARILEELEKD